MWRARASLAQVGAVLQRVAVHGALPPLHCGGPRVRRLQLATPLALCCRAFSLSSSQVSAAATSASAAQTTGTAAAISADTDALNDAEEDTGADDDLIDVDALDAPPSAAEQQQMEELMSNMNVERVEDEAAEEQSPQEQLAQEQIAEQIAEAAVQMSRQTSAQNRSALASRLDHLAPPPAHSKVPAADQRSLSESLSAEDPSADPTAAVSNLPCHPSSLLSLPLLNMLRAEARSTTAFVKMAQRASVAPASTPERRTWRPVPEWDFASDLAIPASKNDKTWLAYQKALATNQQVQSGGDKSVPADASPFGYSQEPFNSAQITAHLDEFMHSATLHQCQLIIDAVNESQPAFLATHAKVQRERLEMQQAGKLQRPAQVLAQIKKWKNQLASAWKPRQAPVLVAMVDAFLRFMDEPVNEPEQRPSADPIAESQVLDAFTLPSAETSEQPAATVQSHLLRNRSGRLRFDPTLAALANFSAPHEWYPLARSLPRKFVVHVGPTNSGKTYHAMQRLMQAKSGGYFGPLRLLAWEVADKMNRAGVACNLVTGQEQALVPGALHTSGTVEMASVDTIIDVAVIDEVQMIASSDRGASWTRALLGLAAYEIHCCGDSSMVEIVEELCAITGEPVEIREYQRLTPLLVAPPLARGLRDVKKGDCIVAFSRRDLYAIKKEIETTIGLKVCIIYGSLPPEARRQQAGLFNDPASGYSVLVATDAIGMGLNLNIARVIFHKMQKFDGDVKRPLTPSEVLQIAGRAGRFSTGGANATGDASKVSSMEEAAKSNRGEVTTIDSKDHPYLSWAMKQSLGSIQRAGLAPTYDQIELLHRLRPEESLSNLLTYFAQYAKVDSLYFTVDMSGMKEIADVLEDIPLASLKERWTFAQAPSRMDNQYVRQAMTTYAELYASGSPVPANAMQLPNLKTPTNQINMQLMEAFYQVLDLYVWLGIRCGPTQFMDLEQATKVRETVARIVQRGIESLSPSDAWLTQRRKVIDRRARKTDAARGNILDGENNLSQQNKHQHHQPAHKHQHRGAAYSQQPNQQQAPSAQPARAPHPQSRAARAQAQPLPPTPQRRSYDSHKKKPPPRRS